MSITSRTYHIFVWEVSKPFFIIYIEIYAHWQWLFFYWARTSAVIPSYTHVPINHPSVSSLSLLVSFLSPSSFYPFLSPLYPLFSPLYPLLSPLYPHLLSIPSCLLSIPSCSLSPTQILAILILFPASTGVTF